MSHQSAIILLSGGMDSTTCLAIAKAQGYQCYALSFDYGQKGASELDAAQKVARHFQAKAHKIVDMTFLHSIGGSALTQSDLIIPEPHSDHNIPITYVPARNTIFLSLALAWAEVIKVQHIFIGVSAIDYSGYPDCRPEYLQAYEKMANLATKTAVEGQPLSIHTPLINLSKAETILEGQRLGVDYSMTVSCYRADATGAACGHCDSCRLRQQGFVAANIDDSTRYIKP